jgi:hypothetical protein
LLTLLAAQLQRMLEQKARMQRKVRIKRRATDGNKDDKKEFLEAASGSEDENEYDEGDAELANAKVVARDTASAAARIAAVPHNSLLFAAGSGRVRAQGRRACGGRDGPSSARKAQEGRGRR